MKTASDIILRPVITETSMDLARVKKYVFEVAKSATKPDIASAAEELFKVEVADVNIINTKQKPKRMGVHAGYTSAKKKAIVTLTEDSKPIEFFEGMM